MAQKNQVAPAFEMLEADYQLPVSARGAGGKTKYVTDEQLDAIYGLQVKQGLALPLADVPNGKDAKAIHSRQRTATSYILNSNPLYVKGNQRYTVAVDPNKGLIVYRTDDAKPVVPEV